MNASANAAANMARSAGNAMSNSNTAATATEKNAPGDRAARDENNFAADGTSTDAVVTGAAPPAAVVAPPPPPKMAEEQSRAAREADLPKAKAEDRASGVTMRESERKDASKLKQ